MDFSVVHVPTAYNVILGHSTLRKIKIAITSYLLQIQYEVDDGSVEELFRDQRNAGECYLVSIKLLMGHPVALEPAV